MHDQLWKAFSATFATPWSSTFKLTSPPNAVIYHRHYARCCGRLCHVAIASCAPAQQSSLGCRTTQAPTTPMKCSIASGVREVVRPCVRTARPSMLLQTARADDRHHEAQLARANRGLSCVGGRWTQTRPVRALCTCVCCDTSPAPWCALRWALSASSF